MSFANPVTLLFLACSPAVILIVIGVMPSIRRTMHRAISATALATGLGLLVLVLLVVGAYGIDELDSVADSHLIMLGLPLVCFAIALSVLARRGRLSLLSAAASGVVGVISLWYLGGVVLMLSACSFSPGGC
jgi:hypothetical protein